jgi:hypothetical protein
VFSLKKGNDLLEALAGRWNQDLENACKVSLPAALEVRQLGHDHPDTLPSVSNLGTVLYIQGKYQEAEAMHLQALEARGEHPDGYSN